MRTFASSSYMCFLHSTFLFGFRKLIVEVVELKGMSSSRMWVRIIENELGNAINARRFGEWISDASLLRI